MKTGESTDVFLWKYFHLKSYRGVGKIVSNHQKERDFYFDKMTQNSFTIVAFHNIKMSFQQSIKNDAVFLHTSSSFQKLPCRIFMYSWNGCILCLTYICDHLHVIFNNIAITLANFRNPGYNILHRKLQSQVRHPFRSLSKTPARRRTYK